MPRFLSLAEAVEDAVRDGDAIALEGFTHLIPHAAGHEIIRQKRKNLTLIRMTPDLIYDQMIGAGCAAELTFSWGGNPGVGSLHRLRDAVENAWPQPLRIHEHSHAGMPTIPSTARSRVSRPGTSIARATVTSTRRRATRRSPSGAASTASRAPRSSTAPAT